VHAGRHRTRQRTSDPYGSYEVAASSSSRTYIYFFNSRGSRTAEGRQEKRTGRKDHTAPGRLQRLFSPPSPSGKGRDTSKRRVVRRVVGHVVLRVKGYVAGLGHTYAHILQWHKCNHILQVTCCVVVFVISSSESTFLTLFVLLPCTGIKNSLTLQDWTLCDRPRTSIRPLPRPQISTLLL
jgi:hypothetical protein